MSLSWIGEEKEEFASPIPSLECDAVSSFRGKGKKSAWQSWNVCVIKISDVFSKLSQYPPAVDNDDLETSEKFVVTMYDRSSTAEGADDARPGMFARRQRSYNNNNNIFAIALKSY